jgi:acetyl-CoA acyltransferase
MRQIKINAVLGAGVMGATIANHQANAGVLLVVSEDYLKKIGQDPVARFAGFAVRGVAAEIMCIGLGMGAAGIFEKF